jgi:hypothetical protein
MGSWMARVSSSHQPTLSSVPWAIFGPKPALKFEWASIVARAAVKSKRTAKRQAMLCYLASLNKAIAPLAVIADIYDISLSVNIQNAILNI